MGAVAAARGRREMGARAMPILITNMGGEMVYILEQRLEAQNVPKDKGQRLSLIHI